MSIPSLLKGPGCGNEIFEGSISLKKLWKMASINLAYVYKVMAYWAHRKCCEVKRTVFKRLVELEYNFVNIQVFMRAFYDSLNQVDSIFSSKVII